MINILDCPCLVRPTIHLVKAIYNAIKIIAPVGLIIFGMIDLGKAVISKDESEVKKSQGSLIKKVFAAVMIFLVFIIVDFALAVVEKSGVNVGDWLSCWQNPGRVDSSECTSTE